jgi:hypothetical protein
VPIGLIAPVSPNTSSKASRYTLKEFLKQGLFNGTTEHRDHPFRFVYAIFNYWAAVERVQAVVSNNRLLLPVIQMFLPRMISQNR